MINYIQSCNEITVLLTNEHLQNIIHKATDLKFPIENIIEYIDELCCDCMCSFDYIFISLCKYILNRYHELRIFKEIKQIVHKNNVSNEFRLKYLVYMIRNTFRTFFIV